MRDSATGPVTIAAEIWSRPDVLTALRHRDIGQLFRLIIDLTDLSQTRIGTATGFAQGRVSNIVHGRTQVKGVAPLTRIADGLGMSARARAALGLAPGSATIATTPSARQPGEAARQLVYGTGYPATTEQAITSVTGLWQADDNRSHDLLSAPPDPAAWNAAALAWLVSPPDTAVPDNPAGRAVGQADIARVRSSSALFADLDNRFGGAHARRSLIHYLSHDAAALLAGRYTEDTGRDLFAAVAEASLLAAWTSYDCGLQGPAQRYFIHALRLAQSAGDRQLACSVMSAMSHQATYLGNLTEAVSLARAAHAGLRDRATPALTAQFLAMQARALARMGDARGCHAALAAAERTFQAPEAGHDPDFIGYFNEAEFTAEAAHCFRDLGDARQAASHAASAIPSDGTYARSDFFVTIVQAEALADLDEPGQACQVALDALTIAETLTSARCVTYTRDFRKRLRRFGQLPEVRDFTAQAAGHALWIKAA